MSKGSDGYITLAVLVMVGLMAALVSGLLLASRPALGLADIGADEVTVDGLLDGGLTGAAFLLYGTETEPNEVNGVSMRFRSGTVHLTVADEGGRIDVNAAEPDLLAGLYEAVGGKSLTPDSFAGRIVDWRDEDEDTGVSGAEAPDYESAGKTYRPANRPFRSVDELRLLLGLSPQDFDRIEPLVTVYTRQGTLDPMSASPTALLAVPNMTRPEVKRLIEARRTGQTREQLNALIAAHEQFFSTETSGVFRVGVQARLVSGYTQAVETVISTPLPEDSADYRVVAWSRVAQPVRAR